MRFRPRPGGFWIGGACVVLVALVSVAVHAGADGINVVDPWIRHAPPGAMALAGYLTLRNDSAQAQSLVGVHADAFGSVMMHRTVVEGGIARMAHESKLEIAPNSRLEFAPGGLHLMLMNPKRPLRAGERVEMQLEFAGGLRLPANFEVRTSR